MKGPDHPLSRVPAAMPPKRTRPLAGGAALGVLSLVVSAFVAQADLKFYPGVVLIEYYQNIPGTAVSALTGSSKFPNSPDRVVFAATPEIPVDAMNEYGVRIRGVLTLNPALPQDAYALVMNSDDQGQLYLSSGTNAANKVLIAREPEWNGSRAWGSVDRRPDTAKVDPAQQAPNVSVPQIFVPGQGRYFELLMKEGSGGDNLAMTTVPEINLPTLPANGTAPDFTGFELGVWADDVPRVLSGPRLKTGSAVAGQETTLTAIYYAPPGTATSYQWFRNGVAIAGATEAEYTFTPAAGDAGANYRVQITVDGKSGQSADVALRFDAFSPGFAKVEFFYDIGGATDVASLINSAKYQANTPDEVRFVTAAATPTDLVDNYGARLSFMYIAPQDGDFRFFTRSDDASRIYLSTDGTLEVSTATVLAEETACCNPFMEPENARTSAPQTMTAGQTNLIFGLMKEGGGGDFLQIAVRREGDTTPAGGLRPAGGSVIGVMANGTGVGLTIAQNPANTNITEERTAIFEARGAATPAGTPVSYQWQRNGVNIPGATSSRLVLTNVPLSEDNTTYRAIIGTIGGIQQTTTAATLDVVPDTFPPQPRLAALKTSAGEYQVSVTWDEQVLDQDASNQVNYSVSPGTVSAFQYWPYDQGAVLTLSGVQGGQTIQVTVNNVGDLKGNRITTPVTRSVTLSNLLTWTGIGEDRYNRELATTRFSDGAVALNNKDFDLISGGDQNWVNYDEATFVYEEITGDFDRAVRVEYQDPTSQWARAGLMIRETLDTGITHAQVDGGYQMSQDYTIRVNPTVQAGGAAGNNSYELIHRPVQGGNYDGYPAQYNIQSGFGGAPNYPTAWMRLRRIGQTIEAYKSDDGVTWTGPATITYTDNAATAQDETLTPTVFVGMYYAPEFANNNTFQPPPTGRGESGIAKFRDYGPFSSGGGGPRLSITRNGGALTLSWTGSGTLQEAPSITGPWTDSLSQANPQTFESFGATLNAANEVASACATRTGTGTATVTLNANNTVTVNLSWSGLSGNTTAAHFHAPANATQNANVIYGFTPPLGQPSGSLSETVTLVDKPAPFGNVQTQLSQIRSGQWYINVHSSSCGSGEIRGQVEPRGMKFYRIRP